MPPSLDWLSSEFWAEAAAGVWAGYVANRDNIVPLATFFVQLATFIGAAIVAGAALAQARTARRRHEEQTTADRERRITESFAKAVEQLGSDKLETRLGAIYTLERIARESEREYWPIMETLTAFVREHAPWPPPGESMPAEEPENVAEPASSQVRPATDIQAILTVLGRRDEKVRKQDEAAERRLDFRAIDLRGANLRGAHLERANLIGAHLEDARLGEAHLERAVGLTQEQLDMASGDDRTVLPDGLTQPPHWLPATPDVPDNPE